MATYCDIRCPECGEVYSVVPGKGLKGCGLKTLGSSDIPPYSCRICGHRFWNRGEIIRPDYDNLEDYRGTIRTRRYWDPFEAKSITGTLEDRLANLSAFVKLGGDLLKEIDAYAEDRSSIYTDDIMTAVMTYLQYLISGENYGLDETFTDRIKCLDKAELVQLLSEELKVRIVENEESCWVLRKDNLCDDSILSGIEATHRMNHPDETPAMYARRKKNWSASSHGFWYNKDIR